MWAAVVKESSTNFLWISAGLKVDDKSCCDVVCMNPGRGPGIPGNGPAARDYDVSSMTCGWFPCVSAHCDSFRLQSSSCVAHLGLNDLPCGYSGPSFGSENHAIINRLRKGVDNTRETRLISVQYVTDVEFKTNNEYCTLFKHPSLKEPKTMVCYPEEFKYNNNNNSRSAILAFKAWQLLSISSCVPFRSFLPWQVAKNNCKLW